MSTLEKAIDLLHKMPETNLEMVYSFMKFLQTQPSEIGKSERASAFGIAHRYADPSLIASEKGAFENEMAKKHALN